MNEKDERGGRKPKQAKLDDFAVDMPVMEKDMEIPQKPTAAVAAQMPAALPKNEEQKRTLDLSSVVLPRTKNRLAISFYPYRTIKSTIRQAGGTYQVRISDMLRDAPPEVISALLRILVSKVNRRRVPKETNDLFQSYVHSPPMLERLGNVRRTRGRKDMADPCGARHDLIPIFERLNTQFFGAALDMPALGWSKRNTTALFGHYDKDHKSITISRTLDSDDVPAFVLEYVLFHEMLHLVYDVKYKNQRRCVHGPEFKRHEGIFPKFEEAKGWLKKIHRRGHRGLARPRKRRKQRVKRDV
jgi:hypothetical protein